MNIIHFKDYFNEHLKYEWGYFCHDFITKKLHNIKKFHSFIFKYDKINKFDSRYNLMDFSKLYLYKLVKNPIYLKKISNYLYKWLQQNNNKSSSFCLGLLTSLVNVI